MSTTKTQRVVTLLLAVMFFGSTIGGAAYYVLANNSQQDEQAALQQQIQNQTSNQGVNKLQGTTLTNFQPMASIPALQTVDTKEGDGVVVKAGDTVTAHYTGAVASTGVIFQSSHDSGSPIPFSLDDVPCPYR